MSLIHENPDAQTESQSVCPTGIRVFNRAGDVVRLGCHQWKCSYCRVNLSRAWASRVRYGIALWNGPAFHWTLTLPPKIGTPAQAFYLLPLAWDNLRKFCQRRLPDFHYAAFVELHPRRSGIAHFHIVALHKSPIRIKDMAHRAGFGYMATEDPIDGKESAYYVTKYTSKQGAQMPKGFRRVRLSRTWPNLPGPIPDPPLIPHRPPESLADYLSHVSALVGITIPDAMARWEHRELDIS